MGQKTYKYNRLLKLVTLALLISLVIYCVKTQHDISTMQGKLEAVQQQVEQQRLVNKDLELSLRRDDSYMERSARKKLDYAHPEERVYVDTSGAK